MPSTLRVTSRAFLDDDVLQPKYTCDGEGCTPPFTFSDVPPEAKSLAFVMDDPDSPGGIFTHWILFNMRPDVRELKESQLPSQVQMGTNTAGQLTYYPPCPDKGEHRYIFTLYALDTLLSPGNKDRLTFDQEIQNHILASGQIQTRYTRK